MSKQYGKLDLRNCDCMELIGVKMKVTPDQAITIGKFHNYYATLDPYLLIDEMGEIWQTCEQRRYKQCNATEIEASAYIKSMMERIERETAQQELF